MPCIMPKQPYCPACHYGYIVYDENDDTHCEWNCLLTEEEYKKYNGENDPMWKLFDYACEKFYTIEYGNDCQPRIIKGFLLNCGGPRYCILTEHGLCIIKSKEINTMFPIPMPKDLPDNFRLVIEQYLKERSSQDVKEK